MPSIRRATSADLDTLTPLFEGYLRFHGREHASGAARAFIAERLERGESIVFLAEAGGFAQVYPSFSSTRLARTWVLNDLFVAPEARRNGIGRALLRAVVEAAGEAGAVAVSLATQHENEQAQALYESEGFVADNAFRHYARALGAGTVAQALTARLCRTITAIHGSSIAGRTTHTNQIDKADSRTSVIPPQIVMPVPTPRAALSRQPVPGG